MKKFKLTNPQWRGVTLVELLVVVVIISILATIATGVYVGEAERARIAGTKDLIRQLELAISRYEVDLGQYPPSGSGPGPQIVVNDATRIDGSGFLYVALMHSMSGNALIPAAAAWNGPYINIQRDQLAPPDAASADTPTLYNILDSFGNPMLYVNRFDYETVTTTFSGGSSLFSGTAPTGANIDIPAPNPFIQFGETYYNPSTYQIISLGPNGDTLGRVSSNSTLAENFAGTEADDITNFGF